VSYDLMLRVSDFWLRPESISHEVSGLFSCLQIL